MLNQINVKLIRLDVESVLLLFFTHLTVELPLECLFTILKEGFYPNFFLELSHHSNLDEIFDEIRN